MTGHIQHLSFESLVKMGHFQKEPPLNLKGTTGAKGSEIPVRLNVRFGSEADIRAAKSHVHFTPESGHSPHEVTRSRAAALRLQMGPTSNKGLQLRYINGDSSSNDTSFDRFQRV